MSREIKFRAWDKVKKQMLVEKNWPADLLIWCDGRIWDFSRNTDPTDGDEVTDSYELMQYTGLKEKNGVEIYEGDVLRFNLHGAKVCPDSVVEYEPRGARFVCRGMAHNDRLDYNETGIYEVIGNIYENPELLEKE